MNAPGTTNFDRRTPLPITTRGSACAERRRVGQRRVDLAHVHIGRTVTEPDQRSVDGRRQQVATVDGRLERQAAGDVRGVHGRRR